MNERFKELAEQAGWMMGDEVEGFNTRLEKFAELVINDFYNLCDQAWNHNEKEKSKEGVSNVEQLVFAGAMAQCQKMKENIKEHFGLEE